MTEAADSAQQGERLARVTYLFGGPAPESAAPVTASPSAATAKSTTSETPKFEAPTFESPTSKAPTSEAPTSESLTSEARGSESAPDLPPKRLAGFGTADLSDIRAQMDEITSRPQPQLPESDGERSARAHNVSMHALTRRGQSRQEIVDLLRRRELEENDIQVEVSRLEAVGLINDYELAETLVRTLRERKALGGSAIVAELRRRKLDAEAIDQALSDAGDTRADELERARDVAAKRAPQLRSLDPETARRRLGAYLMRKGYSGSVVASAVAAALSTNGPSARGPRFE